MSIEADEITCTRATRALPVTPTEGNRTMHLKRALISSIWVICLPCYAWAQDSTVTAVGKVIQIAGETVYVDREREWGWTEGQILELQRNGVNVGELRVVRMSDRFCACRFHSIRGRVVVGDDVRGIVIETRTGERIEPNREVAVNHDTLSIDSQTAQSPEAVTDTNSERHAAIRGKVALRYLYSDDQQSGDHDMHQPALVIDWHASQIGGIGLNFDFRLRARRQTSRNTTNPMFRLYDLGYDSKDKRL